MRSRINCPKPRLQHYTFNAECLAVKTEKNHFQVLGDDVTSVQCNVRVYKSNLIRFQLSSSLRFVYLFYDVKQQ